MISLYGNKCSGCSSCAQVCPKSCIQMCKNKEGFLYPKINAKECINCGKCEKACPNTNPITPHISTESYAAYCLDNTIRSSSSSGGIFTLFAEYILKNGGVVFGAAFVQNLEVTHTVIETVNDLKRLRGSKYVQSNICNTYAEAQQYLKSGRLVYFSGTPCQISGLNAFLGKKYDNLITQDLICHGVPSPLIWKKYIEYHEKASSSKARRAVFRDKTKGWRLYSVLLEFSDSSKYSNTYQDDIYMQAFLSNISLRPSCYNCNFKGIHRPADITLADFWGIDKVMPEMDDNRGCSLILVHSDKGRELLHKLTGLAIVRPTTIEKALLYNPSAIHSVPMPKNRKIYFSLIRIFNPHNAKRLTSILSLPSKVINILLARLKTFQGK